MISSVIWLVLLGSMLLVPNVVALRTAIAGADERQAARMAAKAGGASRGSGAQAVSARPRRTIPVPRLLRRGYLWKALSPLLFALSVMFGIAVGGTTGYVIMALGLLNLLLGVWGWGEYVPCSL